MENTSCCFKKFTPFFFHLEQIFFAIIAAIYKYLPNEISCPLLGKINCLRVLLHPYVKNTKEYITQQVT